jgi:hypothetical protein
MALYPKPAEGSWTERYPAPGTGVVSYEDCVSPEFYEVEREAVFKRAWLNVFPREETRGSWREFTCKYHAWRYDLTGKLTFVQQESEFFDLDKDDYGLLPVHCEAWAGFVFVNPAKEPKQTLPEFLGPMITPLDGYPFDRLTERYDFRADVHCNRKVFLDAFQEYCHVPVLHSQEATPAARPRMNGFEAPHYQLDGPHRMVTTSGAPRRLWPADCQYPIEIATRSGLFGPWDEPDLGTELGGTDPGTRSRTPAPSWGPSGRWSHGRPATTSPWATRSCWYGISTGRSPTGSKTTSARPWGWEPVSDTLLPEAFAELEPFAATWCLATEPERYERRLASDMTELQALYGVGFPRTEEALAYCDKFPLDALPDQARRLLELVHPIITVSMCVEIWHRPRVVDGANAEIHRVAEPLP